MCILFFLSIVVLAATDLVDGHHRRLLQDHGDVSKEDHHFYKSDILKKNYIVIYIIITIVGLVIVTLLCNILRISRSREDEHCTLPQPEQ